MKSYLKKLSVPIHSALLLLLAACGSFVHYQVKPGDSLYSIGFKHDIDYKTLAEWNNIPPPYVIHQGQWIRVVSPIEDEEPETIASNNSGLNDVEKLKKKFKRSQNSNATSSSQHAKTNSTKTKKTTEKVSVTPVESDIDWTWPTRGKVVKYFGSNSQGKKGIDISGVRGQAINAAADGIVVYSGSGIIGLGNLVIIKHNKTFLSAYAHNDSLLVKEGQQLKKGQQIAKMGDSGTERVLLHFEIRKDGKPVNPLQYITENRP